MAIHFRHSLSCGMCDSKSSIIKRFGHKHTVHYMLPHKINPRSIHSWYQYRISQYYSYEKSAIFGVDHRSIQKTEGASHNYSYAHNYSYRGDQVFLTTYSTGMVNIFLSLETQTICLLTLDECIFSPLFASTSISMVDWEVELNNSIPRIPVTPFF